MARSRRACPECNRGNPGDACWQMLFGAFRPQATREIKKSQTRSAAEERLLCSDNVGELMPQPCRAVSIGGAIERSRGIRSSALGATKLTGRTCRLRLGFKSASV